MEYKGFRDLKVFKLAYQLALEIFEITKSFPREEKYSLTDQLRRSSRSIPANIAEAWRKRKYIKNFVSKLYDSYGEEGETEVWLNMSKDLGYITNEKRIYFIDEYTEISKMLYSMINKPEKFCN